MNLNVEVVSSNYYNVTREFNSNAKFNFLYYYILFFKEDKVKNDFNLISWGHISKDGKSITPLNVKEYTVFTVLNSFSTHNNHDF